LQSSESIVGEKPAPPNADDLWRRKRKEIWRVGKVMAPYVPIAGFEAIQKAFPQKGSVRIMRNADGSYFAVAKLKDGSYQCTWGEASNPLRAFEIRLPIVKSC